MLKDQREQGSEIMKQSYFLDPGGNSSRPDLQQNHMDKTVIFCFSSASFLSFTAKSLIHLALIFVAGMRWGSCVMFFYMENP